MVGTGIFTITGTAAANLAGPAPHPFDCDCGFFASAYLLSSLQNLPLVFLQLVGAYSYLYTIFGEFPAWIAGWLTVMEFMTAVSGVASGWAAYFKGLLANLG